MQNPARWPPRPGHRSSPTPSTPAAARRASASDEARAPIAPRYCSPPGRKIDLIFNMRGPRVSMNAWPSPDAMPGPRCASAGTAGGVHRAGAASSRSVGLARRPADPRLAGPRDGAGELLRHLPPHRSGARAPHRHRTWPAPRSAPGVSSRPRSTPASSPRLTASCFRTPIWTTPTSGPCGGARADVGGGPTRQPRSRASLSPQSSSSAGAKSIETAERRGGSDRGPPLGRADDHRPASGLRPASSWADWPA